MREKRTTTLQGGLLPDAKSRELPLAYRYIWDIMIVGEGLQIETYVPKALIRAMPAATWDLPF
jgi:hypothetical protein